MEGGQEDSPTKWDDSDGDMGLERGELPECWALRTGFRQARF